MRRRTAEIIALKDDSGFARDDEDSNRFFHRGFVKDPSFDDLQIGDRIEFTPFVGPRGRRAEDVRRVRR